jgi:hypothetical protein
MIKVIDDENRIHFYFPIIHLMFMEGYIPFFGYKNDHNLYLSHVHFVTEKGSLQQMICKNQDFYDIYHLIFFADSSILNNTCMRNYIHAEINNVNITQELKAIAWSLPIQYVRLFELKELLGLKIDDSNLELTNGETFEIKEIANMNIIELS